jgi:H+/Cl- antiporter ClcA
MSLGVQVIRSIRISVYVALVVVGVIVLAWPEEDNLMLVQFNESHGPSMLDSIGLAFIFAGYLPMVLQVIRNFSSILSRIGKATTIILGVTIIVSGICIPLALTNGSDLLLWSSVIVCTLGESVLIFFAFKVSHVKSPD